MNHIVVPVLVWISKEIASLETAYLKGCMLHERRISAILPTEAQPSTTAILGHGWMSHITDEDLEV